MPETPPLSVTPPALAAVQRIPALLQQADSSLLRQVERIHERTRRSVVSPVHLEQVEQAIDALEGGLLRVEGPHGSGVTTLLSHLALRRSSAFWIGEADGGQGAGSLCAQLIGLCDLPVPLVPPSIASDARPLEALLDAAASAWTGDLPLLVLVDAVHEMYQAHYPHTPIFPARIPPKVVILYGCTPGATLPLPSTAKLKLSAFPTSELYTMLDGSFSDGLREMVAVRSQSNFLYLRFAQGLLRSGVLSPKQLPQGLEALHHVWWSGLDVGGQRLACILAAAGEPLPDDVCGVLLGRNPEPYFRQWEALVERWSSQEEEGISTTALYHQATRAFINTHARKEVAHVHAEMAALSYRNTIGEQSRDVAPSLSWEANRYFLRQFGRHAFLSPAQERNTTLPTVASRTWVRFQQRRGSAQAAARDMAWEVWGATVDGSLLRLAKSAFLAASLATLSRSLPTDAPAEVLAMALDKPERDVILKQILAICDQLPDGREKAPVLRRLGEVCYNNRRMRTTAMRLLSQAIDMEGQVPTKAWRDEREELLAALSRAALSRNSWKEALEITPRINHTERRGMVETDVVRALIQHQDLDKAELVAHGIAHDNLRVWAQAEVSVARAVAGDSAGAETLLAGVTLETANAWAHIEIACHEAIGDEEAAKARIERLGSESQRDRGRARLAYALARYDKDGDALAMAEQIVDVAARVNALLDLRLTLEGLVAMLALEQATAVISSLQGDDRVPLIAALAAAHAALGRRERAIAIAEQLEADEEQDRAFARIAVSLAASGDYVQAQEVVALVGDVDERDWALDELARMLGRAGRWSEAYLRAKEIADEDQQARTLAELIINQGQQGDPVTAHGLALDLEHVAERERTLTALVPSLLQAGSYELALRTQNAFILPDSRSKYQAALVLAMLQQGVARDSEQFASLWAQARKLTLLIARPGDRIRALTGLAEAIANRNPVLAQSTLGIALRVASGSRGEMLHCLEGAATLLSQLGSTRLLVDFAAAIDDIEAWLQE